MSAPRYDVLGIGNAIVDVIARTEDDFLVANGMNKGGMALIDEARAEKIYQAMGAAVESSGGSAANTDCRGGKFRMPCGICRQGQERRTRQHLRPRHPFRPRVLYNTAGERRPLDRALLHHGDAGRRAHDEYISWRRAGSQTRRYRRDHGCRRLGGLSRGLFVRIRRKPRKPFSKRRPSRTKPGARSRLRCRIRSVSIAFAPNSSI